MLYFPSCGLFIFLTGDFYSLIPSTYFTHSPHTLSIES